MFSIRDIEVLIKAVALTTSTYKINVFKIPLSLCGDLQSLISRFWWGSVGMERKIHWVRWEILCQPKLESGMGLHGLSAFNRALLAKEGW